MLVVRDEARRELAIPLPLYKWVKIGKAAPSGMYYTSYSLVRSFLEKGLSYRHYAQRNEAATLAIIGTQRTGSTAQLALLVKSGLPSDTVSFLEGLPRCSDSPENGMFSIGTAVLALYLATTDEPSTPDAESIREQLHLLSEMHPYVLSQTYGRTGIRMRVPKLSANPPAVSENPFLIGRQARI